jgi:hypothetical protein
LVGRHSRIGNMRANGVRSLDVVMLELPPLADQERGPVAGRHAGADHRPACGLHPIIGVNVRANVSLLQCNTPFPRWASCGQSCPLPDALEIGVTFDRELPSGWGSLAI